uniref:Pectinesterase inhibitor domain-containing protein n=1 Tax=Cannabis sativa TaxID=3483 RepID=A0A803NUY0_CANSA
MVDLGRPLLLGVIVLFCVFSSSFSSEADFLEPECLKVSNYEFTSSVKTIVDVIQQLTSIFSQFGHTFGDSRVSNAVSDCLDLLDASAEQLSWTVSATQNPKGKHNSTGNLSSDLRTWLSAALINQDTCSDGFEGTNSIVKGLVTGGLNQITSLVQDLLTQVNPMFDSKPKKANKAHFPAWMKPRDRKLVQANGVEADAVVAADGTGNFTKIMDAVLAAPEYSMQRYVIYIKKGTYHENVEIKKKRWNIMMIGDGIDATIISGNRSFIDGWTTFRSATFAVSGRGFIARDITFENTAGPEKHQAVALRSDSDLSVFYRSRVPKLPDIGQKGPPKPKKYHHGPRPWKLFSRTVILQSYISDAVKPQGWLEWNGDFALDTLFYGEFMNFGPGAGLGSRVKWPGYRTFNDSNQVHNYTVAQFIEGNLWLPSTGVKYSAGLQS